MSGSAAGFDITHASRNAAISVFTAADAFPRLTDNTNARGTTVPDNNSNADFRFDDTDKAVDANILI